jgi:hypothetical protein
VGLEDAMALGAADGKLRDALVYAEERLRKHEQNEARRERFGLVSDMDRWTKTGEAWD